MKKMPVRKATKMAGTVVLATHTKPPSKHIPFQGVHQPEPSELFTNRSVNVTSSKVPSVQFQGLDDLSLVSGQHRMKRSRNNVDGEHIGIPTPNRIVGGLGTALRIDRRSQSEPLSDGEGSLISDMSENGSYNDSPYLGASGTTPTRCTPTDAKRYTFTDTGKSQRGHGLPTVHPADKLSLMKSTKAGHDSEPVNFSKDIFDAYATSIPLDTVIAKFDEYQKQRLVGEDKDDRPDFQGPLISFISQGVEQKPELADDHHLSLAIFCYKYWKYIAGAQDSVNIVLNRMLTPVVKAALSPKYPDFRKRNNELLMEALWDAMGPTGIHQMREILLHFAVKVFKFKEIG